MSALPVSPTPSTPSQHPASPGQQGPRPDGPVAGTIGHDPAIPQLGEVHHLELRRAAKRARPVRKAVTYAGFSGWSTLLIGAVGIPFSLSSIPSLALCLALFAIGVNELGLRKPLRRFDPSAPGALGWNQLLLGACVIAYATWGLVQSGALKGATLSIDQDTASGLVTPDGQINKAALDGLTRGVSLLIGLGLIAGTLLFQGLTARYYFAKRKAVRRHLEQTPPWIQGVQRSLAA